MGGNAGRRATNRWTFANIGRGSRSRVLDDQKMWRETLARIVRKHFNQLVPPVG